MKDFTLKVRQEILSHRPSTVCCRRAMLAGILINSECGLDGTVYIRLCGRDCTETARKLLFDVYGLETKPEYSSCYGRLTAEGVVVSEKLSSLLSEMKNADNISAEPSFFRCDKCRQFFAGGLILSSATFSDPEREERVEIRLLDPVTATKINAFFQNSGLFPSMSVRKGSNNLLFKKNDYVEGLLGLAGAGKSAMELIEFGLVRDLKKDMNRVSNCEINNIASATKAATPQLKAIEKLRSFGGFDLLTEDLKITAELRESNPGASLSELCSMHQPAISKSGLNHRLQKILEAAEKIGGGKTD